ncbi:DUF3846 domain-containing protein [Mycolicibacterium sphagni]|uniref:DUF3846 domain-containing protein n=1 Tax=Mycolicibacterium sphagni TaxID=1786 RepID=A0A255DQN3_9MYCO|nr:hypothetical protein [Mycolicibacterium sphagni]OYN81757.1 hypothetical protein CG716_05280 [Mycolicibacterium sphagni]
MSSETKVLVLKTDRTHEVVAVPGDDMDLYRFMRSTIGDDLEAVYGWTDANAERADVAFMLGEHGKLQSQPINTQATALWWALNPDAVGIDRLCGVVVVTGGADRNGDTLPVLDKVIEIVERRGGE